MRKILFMLLLLLGSSTVGADLGPYYYGVFEKGNLSVEQCGYFKVIDKTWELRKVISERTPKCAHEWVYGKPYKTNDGISCAVNHNGGHCSWDDDWRDQICRKCGRLEKYEEVWHEKYIPCPVELKSEFELLRDSFSTEGKSK